MEKRTLPNVITMRDVQKVEFHDAHVRAVVTLTDGTVLNAILAFSRRHPRGFYTDASGRIYRISE